MALLDKLLQRAEKFDPVHPRDPGLVSIFGDLFSRNSSGVVINPDTAMTITAVYSAVSIISETIAMLPWNLYRGRPDGGKEVMSGHPVNKLYSMRPNRFQNPLEYRETMMTVFLLRGRSVAEIHVNNDGSVENIPLHPSHTTPFKAPDGSVAFVHNPPGGPRRTLLASEVIDLRGYCPDGVNALSPIAAAEEALGIAKAAEVYGARFFGSGTVVSGVLQTDEKLSDRAYQRLKEWNERHQGIGKSHNPAILEEGLKWSPVTVNPGDAQLIETRSYQVEDVARIYRIPAYKLQRMDNVKFNTVEQQSIDFVTDTILPRVRRLELAHDMSLLSEQEQQTMRGEIQLRELLRGDSKARSEYNRAMWNMGAFSSNDVLAAEGYNPVEGGDRRYVPVNVMPVDRLDDMPEPSEPSEPRAALRPLAESVFQRLHNAQTNALARHKDMVAFFEGHRDFITRNMAPLGQALDRDLSGYIDGYYLEILQHFEQTGQVTGPDQHIDNFMKWVNENGQD